MNRDKETLMHDLMYRYMLGYELKDKLNEYFKKITLNISHIERRNPIVYIGMLYNDYKEMNIDDPKYLVGESETDIRKQAKDYKSKYDIFPVFI